MSNSIHTAISQRVVSRGGQVLAFVALVILGSAANSPAAERPNILLILADDLGWGDARCMNPQSRVPTPNLDRLATQGLRFTDAHSSSGVCVPSRFSLMTGLHAYRMINKGHPEPQWRGYGGNQSTLPLVPAGGATLAGIMAKAGYSTAMVGKWHLGFEDLLRKPTEQLRGGPTDRGFQRYFGIPSSLDIGPYVFIEGDRIVEQATIKLAAHGSPGWPKDFMGEFWRADLAAPDFRHAEVLPAMTRRAETDLRDLASRSAKQPFFLYYAMPAPHSPLLPSAEFRGSTREQFGEFSAYGDYVAHTDADIGRLLKALDESGEAANTLVIVSSDNGPLWYPQNVAATRHAAAGPWRGMKGDAWEGGHRVPLIARWPGHVPAGNASEALISLTDVLATIAAVLELKSHAKTDGVDFSAVLLGMPWQRPEAHPVVVKSSQGANALRGGTWKYIDRLGSGGFSEPQSEKPAPEGPAGQLYDLATDPGETKNLVAERPDVAEKLKAQLTAILSMP